MTGTLPLFPEAGTRAVRLTDEQEAIVDFEGNATVYAFAGTGKTATLEALANSRGNDRILYLVFNRAMKEAAQKRMPPNVKVSTIHGLAYAAVGHRYGKAGIETPTRDKIMPFLGMGSNKQSYMTAELILRLLTLFWNSEGAAIDESLVGDLMETLSGDAADLAERRGGDILEYTRRLWADMVEERFPMAHDGYVKLYQLTRPALPYKRIFLDEAQDSTNVAHSIIAGAKKATVTVVGDTYQQIYSWRYAVNVMNRFGGKRFTLSNSFRFGVDIAEDVNHIIKVLRGDSEFVLRGAGKPGKVLYGSSLSPCVVYLGRTNVSLLIRALRTKGPLYFEGGVAGYPFSNMKMLHALVDLHTGKRPSIAFFSRFSGLKDLKDYYKNLGEMENVAIVKLVEDYGQDIIRLVEDVVARATPDLSKAHYGFSTVHKAKGQEYHKVEFVSESFPDYDDLETANRKARETGNAGKIVSYNEEINLIYVAATRGKSELSLPLWMSSLDSCDPLPVLTV